MTADDQAADDQAADERRTDPFERLLAAQRTWLDAVTDGLRGTALLPGRLEDVDGIGPTYAGRLRDAGVGSVAELAVAEVDHVAEAAEASDDLAGAWVERARRLIGDAAADGGADD
ncbi:MAG: helix-hairpin-helix domain-containing protein [Haloferacaceae archaeon]